MNSLQVAPLSVKLTPPGPTGGSPAVGEASSFSATKSAQAASHAAQQQRLADARANTARAAAERKAQAEESAATAKDAPAPVDNFDRKVGLVDGTFKVFVDLVKPPGDEPVVRVFGPPENAPAPAPRAPAVASSAYERAGTALPSKDLGVA